MQWSLKTWNPVDLMTGFRSGIDGKPRRDPSPQLCAWQVGEVENMGVEQQRGGAPVLFAGSLVFLKSANVRFFCILFL